MPLYHRFVLFAISAFRHLAFADRPSHHAVLSAIDDEHRHLVSEPDSPLCPQEVPLRQVLGQMGFTRWVAKMNSTQLRDMQGVSWRGCSVVQIRQNTIFINVIPGTYKPGTLDDTITQLADLEKLFLSRNVSGNLAHIGKLKKLRWLNAKHTNLFGDVAFLENLHLQILNLRGTKVTGDLRFLSKSPLRFLNLEDTSVYGDLATLRCDLMTNLQIGNTEVTGDLSALRAARKLLVMKISNTKIHGDVKELIAARQLHFLQGAGCNISGDIMSLIPRWPGIQRVDLSDTRVHGRAGPGWESCCKKLTSLKLARSQVKFVPNIHSPTALERSAPQLPKLRILDLGGCPLHCELIDLIMFLKECKSLAMIQAPNCGLSLELVDIVVFSTAAPLRSVLVALDLGSNNISRVSWIPPNCRSIILANNPDMTFREGLLRQAVEDGVFLDLENVAFTNQSEAVDLLDQGLLQRTERKTAFNQDAGYECFGIATSSASLQVSADKFAPETLCSCSPGWTGHGVQCRKCPADFYREAGDEDCVRCPEGSNAPEGSSTPLACRCQVGSLFQSNHTGWTCGCPKGHALRGELCVKCWELHLNCPEPGLEVHSVLPLPGWTLLKDDLSNEMLVYQCLPPKVRCEAAAVRKNPDSGYCNDGYTGLMCMECDANYHAAADRCEKCQDVSGAATAWQIWSTVAAVTLALGFCLWRWYNGKGNIAQAKERKERSAFQVLTEQVKAQAPILLQTCQLWVVLANLSTSSSARETEQSTQQLHLGDSDSNGFWEVPYLQALQFSVADLKNAWNLQCRSGDGASVRFATALAAPVFPLVVLLGCSALEIFKAGSGITAGLQVITLLYIGGSSSCWNLLSCQETDGAGVRLPESVAFRKSMPYVGCHETSQLKTAVDVVGFSCAFCYAVLIPSCLLYLYARQHVVLGSSRLTVASVETVEDQTAKLKVSLHDVRRISAREKHRALGNEEGMESEGTGLEGDGKTADGIDGSDESSRRLVAAAAAYISVLLRGSVTLRLADGAALVALLEDRETAAGRDFAADVSNVVDVVRWEGRRKLLKQQALTLRCRAITEMLLERCVLQEVLPKDRVLSGARHLLLKYTFCRNLWMEIVQKLVAVALVSVVASADGLQLSLTITLGMAAAVGMVQPYLQPQANFVQGVGFVSLALAALGFRFGFVALGRCALLLPLLALGATLGAPDSAEGLAMRLWEDLEPQMEALRMGETVEVLAETYSFI
eukprot:s268_g11.t1